MKAAWLDRSGSVVDVQAMGRYADCAVLLKHRIGTAAVVREADAVSVSFAHGVTYGRAELLAVLDPRLATWNETARWWAQHGSLCPLKPGRDHRIIGLNGHALEQVSGRSPRYRRGR